jgi:beta-N-acetylhexosaminidase
MTRQPLGFGRMRRQRRSVPAAKERNCLRRRNDWSIAKLRFAITYRNDEEKEKKNMDRNRIACRKKRMISLLLVLCLTLGFVPAASAAEDRASAMLKAMTTEEKVSQMILPAFRWWNDAEGKRQNLTVINDEIAALLERHGFAGVILFAQNAAETEATVRLADAMQSANAKGENRARLLLAIDQEGGSVTRLGQGTAFPGNMALGAANDTDVTKAAARTIGAELKAMGFHFDFAPVVDVNSNPANPVIGTRSFSDDPRLAAKHGAAFVTALMENGTISALKHFPGHGDTGTDSHTGLPRIEKTCDELKANELIPFQACIDAGAEAVMTAHIQYPAIEKDLCFQGVRRGDQPARDALQDHSHRHSARRHGL